MKLSEEPVKFLLVDDLEENLLVLDALLRRDDLELLLARSGSEALELLLAHDVALALIDVQMPEMDGFELAELMRGAERTRDVPIIFVTAGMHERHRVFRGYDAGAVDFLFKPIEPQILKHKTETFFKLHRQKQAIAATLRLNEELMAVVGHDLRNPLHVILMTADVLSRTTEEPDSRKAAARLKSSGARMLRIIDDLLDLSRARLGGGIPIERQAVDLSAIARKIIAELKTTNPARIVELKGDGPTRGEWDPGRMEQVLSNLVGNAERHGVKEEPIVVAIEQEPAFVRISVQNGGHIDPELVPRLFEPFQSGNGQAARTEGLGLGLYIVQQIVLAHDGTVEVESEEGRGTTFKIALPRSQERLSIA
jgi:two-component system sensor histidine kinase/response regulator